MIPLVMAVLLAGQCVGGACVVVPPATGSYRMSLDVRGSVPIFGPRVVTSEVELPPYAIIESIEPRYYLQMAPPMLLQEPVIYESIELRRPVRFAGRGRLRERLVVRERGRLLWGW
jgi:hypothetical protein